MADKILYTNKEKLIDDESIPLKNKVTADDMNEIKGTVNSHADNIETLDNQKADKTEIPTDLSQLSNATTKFVNETQLGNEATVRQNADNDLQGQINNRYTKTEIDNKFNVTNGNIATLQVDSAHRIELSINQTNYVMTATLKNKAGTIISSSNIDLPLESMIVNGTYDNATKKIILTLQNGNTIEIPVGDLISGLQSEITPQNKLSSDLVDDTNHTNKFVTQAEKNQIETNKNNITSLDENKENISNKVTELTEESTDTQYPSAKAVYDNESALKEKLDRYKNTIETELGDSTDTGTELTLNGTAEFDVDLGFSGNTEQVTNIKTYTCVGTETGDYYFTYNNINYQFTMPTIEVNSILAFNTDTLKLYLGETEITTTTDNTGTLITLQNTPNPEYPQTVQVVKGNNEVKLENKNLLDYENLIIKTGYAKDDDGNEIFTGSGNYTTSYTKVKPNTTYTFSADLTSAVYRLYFYDINKNWISRTDSIPKTTKEYTFTTPNNCYYLQFQNVKTYAINDEAQLELGSATSFVPHKEQTYPITLPTGMEICKIRDYADEFVWQNNKWYKNKKINKIILNGTENWWHFSITEGDLFRLPVINDGINDKNYVPYCNAYKGIPLSQKSSRANYNFYIENANIDIVDNRFTTAANFKANLVTNNISIYYPLATPVPEEITDTTLINQLNNIKQAYTYQSQTNISQTNEDLPFIIKADFKLSNLSRIEALENALETVSSRVDLLEE